MKELNAELIEKVKVAKDAEELLAIARENGAEMTSDEAEAYFAQIHSKEIDDDLLGGVAGGVGVVIEIPERKVTDEHPDKYKSACG